MLNGKGQTAKKSFLSFLIILFVVKEIIFARFLRKWNFEENCNNR
mgnify:FL=1